LLTSLASHEHRSVVDAYGHVNLGFSEKELSRFATKAGFNIESCETVTRERRPPHFEVIALMGRKPAAAPARKAAKTGTRKAK
jgi:ArsR family transcriptional regulator